MPEGVLLSPTRPGGPTRSQTVNKAHVTGRATLHLPITKKVAHDDGTVTVFGLASDDTLDRDGQKVDKDWCAKKLTAWFNDFGAPVRVEHDFDLPPAGKGLDIVLDPDGNYVRARIAEKNAVQAVMDDELTDFSIGMLDVPIYADPTAPNGRIGAPDDDSGFIHELSLVKTGSNRNAHTVVERGPTVLAKRANKSAPIKTTKALGSPDRLSKALSKQAKRAAKAEEKSMKEADAADAATTKAAIPDGHVACDACEDGKIKGELPCPKCDGKGHFDPAAKKKGKAAKATDTVVVKDAKTKAAKKDADSDVSSALDDAADSSSDTSDSIGDAQQAQAADDAGEDKSKAAKAAEKAATTKAAADEAAEVAKTAAKVADKAARKAAKAAEADGAAIAKAAGEGPVGATPPAQDGVMRPKKAKKAKKPVASDDGADGDGKPDGKPFPGAAKPFGSKRKGRKGKAAEVPYNAMRMHDVLCPAYSNKSASAAYGDVSPEVIDPEWFSNTLADRSTRIRKAAPGSIAEAAQALEASLSVTQIKPKSFAEMRRAAHKGWLSANPGLPSLKPGLIAPDQFRRPFLAGADDTVSHTTTVPSPALKDPLRPGDYQRGALTEDQTRPTLSNGSSVAKAAPARAFYTNATRDEHAVAMGDMHDFIASNFPGICPLANPPGTSIDSDGQIGKPAEMDAPLPGKPGAIANGDGNKPTAVADTSRANKAAPEEVEKIVKRRTSKLTKEVRRLSKTVKNLTSQAALAARLPDERLASQRRQDFGALSKAAVTDPDARARVEAAREAMELIRTGDSVFATQGLDQLRQLGLPAKDFARLAVGASDN